MMETFVTEYPWLCAAVVATGSLFDWASTTAGHRAYEQLEGRFIRYDQYELTPFLQNDVERSRKLSPRFLLVWLVGSTLIGFYCQWAASWGLANYAIVLVSGILLTQALMVLRHVRNLFTFRLLSRSGGAEGLIHYREWFSQRTFGYEMAMFAALFLTLAASEDSLVLLGACCACLLLWLRSMLRSNKLRARADQGNPAEH